MMENKTNTLIEVASGRHKHDSLSDAALYAAVSGDASLAHYLIDQLEKRNQLINDLVKINARMGCLPGVPAEESLDAFMAIENLAVSNPGAHPILTEIAQIDKSKFFVGNQSSAEH